MADNNETIRPDDGARKGTLKKKIEELKTITKEQDDRLNHLQSNAFQLANFYFLFQGVILTVISNGSSALRHSDIWIPFVLSIFAAIVNLFSVFVIGIEYLRTIEQRDRSLWKQDKKYTQLQKLMSRPQNSNNHEDHVQFQVDGYRKCKRITTFVICELLFLAFAVTMGVACWRVNRSRAAEGKLPPHVNGKCIRICDGSNCISICSE
ncbi:hypothetical protein M0R45_025905 [Rubus argutus]|uniref:Uncharacterized protein n=1 Tax=Rubus argutus TaxID=59490 RepID=A0AAW1WZK3_RUBAR